MTFCSPQWLEEEFIPYLNQWKESAQGHRGFSQLEGEKLRFSQDTRLGLRTIGEHKFVTITVLYIIQHRKKFVGVVCY